MTDSVFARACERGIDGMEIAAVAALAPERIALWSAQGTMTYAELNAATNRLVRRLRAAGLAAGDAVALVCSNRTEFAVVRFATHRAGLRLTPINWHLSPEDIGYIVEDCGARALFLDGRVAPAAPTCVRLRVGIGGGFDGWLPWAEALDGFDCSDIGDPVLGNTMLYTSGTTGRPKGVVRAVPEPGVAARMQQALATVFQFDPDGGKDRALATGPLYHMGPFSLCFTTPLCAGIGVVVMDHWDPENMLALIERHRITHTFRVPTMFNRLLQLPEQTRRRYDVSSLRFVIHGGAPCSVDVKRRMLDWWGPVLWEMFGGTEGPGTIVGPQEWLARPGTVGCGAPGQIRILDALGNELPPGQAGIVYLANPPGSDFQYHKDPGKTASAHHGSHFTAGDIGYVDEDGYLFLTGRSAEIIISGGVNLYPQEIDDVLARQPAVADVACIGVPNDDLGEEVKAVIELRAGHEGDDALRDELLRHCARHLSKQKWPRSIEFVPRLPRSATGKMLRSTVRAPYWAGRDRQI